MDGALMEIGPYRVRPGGKLEYNNGSWDEFANLLFVDNPVGTGFSYVDSDSYIHELDEMKDQFILFLEKWFAIFPEYENDDVSRSIIHQLVQPLILCSCISQANRMPVSISLTLPKASWNATKTNRKRDGTFPVSSSETAGFRLWITISPTFLLPIRTAC